MKKSLNVLTFVLILSSVDAPALRAERTGCNPHPQAIVAAPSVLEVITYTVFNYFGF